MKSNKLVPIMEGVKRQQKKIAGFAKLMYFSNGETKKKYEIIVKSLINQLCQRKGCAILACWIITQDKGGKTPGKDKKVWGIDELETLSKRVIRQKSFSGNRWVTIESPKGMNPPKMRTLGIPVIQDRVGQYCGLMGHDPMWEGSQDELSLGFRRTKNTSVGKEWIENHGREYQYVLECDIEKFFDKISHEGMLKNIPFVRRKALREILKKGCEGKDGDRDKGTPQGGILSPGLANYTLSDLGRNRESKYVRFADDFIVFTNDWEKEMKYIVEFLAERGLNIQEKKTKVHKKGDCFEFGGFCFQNNEFQMLSGPRKKSFERLILNLREGKKKNDLKRGKLCLKSGCNYFRQCSEGESKKIGYKGHINKEIPEWGFELGKVIDCMKHKKVDNSLRQSPNPYLTQEIKISNKEKRIVLGMKGYEM